MMFNKIIFVLLILLLAFNIGFAQRSTQNENLWSLYGGTFDTFWVLKDSSTSSDSIWFNYVAGSDSVFYSEAFKLMPYNSTEIVVADSASATDSIKFVVHFLQSGEPTKVAATNFKMVKDLSWSSTSSATTSDTLTAAGRYSANITDTAIFAGQRWGRYAVECFSGNKIATGNYVRIIHNGWNER